jgi:hypothetical protein
MLDFDDVFPTIATLKVLIIEDDQELGEAFAEMLELGACPGNGICRHKGLAKVAGFCRLLLSGQLGKVMGGADQCPFVFDPVDAAEEELTEAAGCFDLAEDGFNGMFA